MAAASRCKYFDRMWDMRKRAIDFLKSNELTTNYVLPPQDPRMKFTAEETAVAKFKVYPFRDAWRHEDLSVGNQFSACVQNPYSESFSELVCPEKPRTMRICFMTNTGSVSRCKRNVRCEVL